MGDSLSYLDNLLGLFVASEPRRILQILDHEAISVKF